ncbi:MAG: putative toxin-antitoxin system toxin component, PIN family [Pyrinomonadaceae bacterium]|nr:putative toxin-antitoxin system toxin component, PIN family [Pyrinomonadaceae bacterium]
MRGVIDNSVLVSAAIVGGIPRRALDLLFERGTIIVSVDVLEELNDTLDRTKFDRYSPHTQRRSFIRELIEIAELVRITEPIRACRDPNDDKFLELAVSGDADYLITGDSDLLVLNPFRGVEIVTPRDFVQNVI